MWLQALGQERHEESNHERTGDVDDKRAEWELPPKPLHDRGREQVPRKCAYAPAD
jgi:hypothetical protein